MLDRAVTLSVRHFVPLALIWAIYIVPLLLLANLGLSDTAKLFSTVFDTLSKGGAGSDPNSLAKALSLTPVYNAYTVLYFALFVVGQPLCTAALLGSASDAYLTGNVPGFVQAYREGLRQWLPLVGVTLIWIALGVVAYLILILIGVIVGLAVGLLIYAAKAFGIAVAVVLGIVALVALVVAATLALLAFRISYMTQVVEHVGFVRAFTSGISRVIGKSWQRSLLFGLALFAVNVGIGAVALAGQGLLFGVFRSNLLGSAFSAILGVLSAVLGGALTTVYYYDIRVRSEGYDLQQEIAEPAAAAISSPSPP
jgi:hypothetical protein